MPRTISDAFKVALIADGLKVEKLIGIGVDEANVMVYQHNSLASCCRKVHLPFTSFSCWICLQSSLMEF